MKIVTTIKENKTTKTDSKESVNNSIVQNMKRST